MPGMQPPMAGAVTGDVSGSVGEAKLYGALLDQELQHDAEAARTSMSKRRRRMNCFPLLLALLLPWCTFCFTFATAAFFIHYSAPFSSTLCEIAVLGLCLYQLPSAWRSFNKSPSEGFYPLYLAAAMAIAAAVGWGMGDFTFYSYMEPAYSSELMVSYSEVNPSSTTLVDGQTTPTSGGRFQDAGKVYFSHDTQVDVSRAFSFKMADVYCVAPIMNTKCSKNCGEDFWAVGKNCCSEDGKDFHCGDVGSKKAKSGLRLMEEKDVPFYRLAVIEAAGKNQMISQHPIFFHWLVDPVAEIHSWQKQGFRRFIIAMLVSFGVSGAALAWTLKTMHLVL